MDITLVHKNIAAVADRWSPELATRLERRALDKADFATLRDAGLTLTGVPEDMGGVWHNTERSTRPLGAIFRTLARVDPSVALVATMHPTVLALWLEQPVEPPIDPELLARTAKPRPSCGEGRPLVWNYLFRAGGRRRSHGDTSYGGTGQASGA